MCAYFYSLCVPIFIHHVCLFLFIIGPWNVYMTFHVTIMCAYFYSLFEPVTKISGIQYIWVSSNTFFLIFLNAPFFFLQNHRWYVILQDRKAKSRKHSVVLWPKVRARKFCSQSCRGERRGEGREERRGEERGEEREEKGEKKGEKGEGRGERSVAGKEAIWARFISTPLPSAHYSQVILGW